MEYSKHKITLYVPNGLLSKLDECVLKEKKQNRSYSLNQFILDAIQYYLKIKMGFSYLFKKK